jgi:hypothetical protein
MMAEKAADIILEISPLKREDPRENSYFREKEKHESL